MEEKDRVNRELNEPERVIEHNRLYREWEKLLIDDKEPIETLEGKYIDEKKKMIEQCKRVVKKAVEEMSEELD